MTNRRFGGKVALITGSASGIGRATALRIASEGGTLVLADRDLAGAEDTARAAINAGAPDARALGFDAANPADCRHMVDQAAALYGRLDCVINNAGIYRRGHFLEMDPREWDLVLATNLTSSFDIIQQALPHLISTRGNIVSTASTAGTQGIAYAAAYAAAKAGVIALTKSLAAEFAPHGVRVNAICPGRIHTALGKGMPQVDNIDLSVNVQPPKLAGKSGAGEPEDIAGAFAYLASDDAAYATGTILIIDGGQTVG